MKHFQQLISQIPPFGNTNLMSTQILYVEAVSLILSKLIFHGYNIHYSPLMDLFYINCENLSYQNTVNINLHFQSAKRLCLHDLISFN
jgi:hypothetical protein